jgi:hypothetical protein
VDEGHDASPWSRGPGRRSAADRAIIEQLARVNQDL